MSKITFIGIGVMGSSMAANLLKAGHEITVYTRTKAKAEKLLAQGAKWESSPAKASENAEIVISMVGYPRDVEEIYLGENGVLSALKSGSTIIDMTTSSPKLAQKIYQLAKEKGISALDAPVSGGDVGAKNAALAIMVGGDKDTYDKMLPVFEAMAVCQNEQSDCHCLQHDGCLRSDCLCEKMRLKPAGVTERHFYGSCRFVVAFQSGAAHAQRRFRAGIFH